MCGSFVEQTSPDRTRIGGGLSPELRFWPDVRASLNALAAHVGLDLGCVLRGSGLVKTAPKKIGSSDSRIKVSVEAKLNSVG
jgi:hypothetical protein